MQSIRYSQGDREKKSVVCRELARNSNNRSGDYSYDLAHRKYRERMEEKPKLIRFTSSIKDMVEEGLEGKLSPEQIVGISKNEGTPCVSVERIYQHVWSDKKQKGQLFTHLRNQGKRYRKRGSSKDSRGIIKDRVPIEDRPAEVEEKLRFGDLEVDTVIGKNHQGAIVIEDRLEIVFYLISIAYNFDPNNPPKMDKSLCKAEKIY